MSFFYGNKKITEKININNYIGRLLILALLLVGVLSRYIMSILDRFDTDDYSLMLNVGKGFFEYSVPMWWFQFPAKVHYWIAYRLFGGDLFSYRIFPLISSILLLVIVIWAVKKFW